MKRPLIERVVELRLWAVNRIEWCRGEEQRLGVNGIGIYEAAQERRTLQAVLRILDDEPTPPKDTAK
jgi:hypothetical protein